MIMENGVGGTLIMERIQTEKQYEELINRVITSYSIHYTKLYDWG